MSEIPRDQTSDLTVYCAPCIRSGYETRSDLSNARFTEKHHGNRTHAHIG